MPLADGGATPKVQAPQSHHAAATQAVSGGYDPTTFAKAVLTKMGLPVTPENLNFMTSWEASEGGNWNNSASYNPLNTSLKMPGMLGTMGSQGNIARYANWQQGIDATVQTLSSQSHGYPAIINALKVSDAQGAVNALKASAWDVNHYSGGFPLGGGAAYAQQHGATPDGIATTGDTSGGTPATSSGVVGSAPGQDVADYLSSQYGYMASYLNDPELGPILKEAATGGWSDARLEGALAKTNWWKTTGATARSWVSLNRIDPATAKATLATTQAHVKALASASGVALSGSDIYHMAYAANMFGWSDLQLQQSIGAQFKYNPGKTQSGAGLSDVQQMKQLASDYMVPVADATLQKYAQAAISGNYNVNDFESYVKQQALSMYANNKTMVNSINAGIKPTTFVDPYRQLIAQTTEVAPESINFMDPKYMKFINQVDPKSGTYAPMNLSDTATVLRTNAVYGYDKTAQAKQEATNLATSLGQKMGFI